MTGNQPPYTAAVQYLNSEGGGIKTLRPLKLNEETTLNFGSASIEKGELTVENFNESASSDLFSGKIHDSESELLQCQIPSPTEIWTAAGHSGR